MSLGKRKTVAPTWPKDPAHGKGRTTSKELR